MFGKINDKQDISNIKNVARLAPNFKFAGAPCGNEQASKESLFLIINDSYNGKINVLNSGEIVNNTFTVYGENCKFN
jgi:hypothetical protein